MLWSFTRFEFDVQKDRGTLCDRPRYRDDGVAIAVCFKHVVKSLEFLRLSRKVHAESGLHISCLIRVRIQRKLYGNKSTLKINENLI